MTTVPKRFLAIVAVVMVALVICGGLAVLVGEDLTRAWAFGRLLFWPPQPVPRP